VLDSVSAAHWSDLDSTLGRLDTAAGGDVFLAGQGQ
jgi:hypothetical protein